MSNVIHVDFRKARVETAGRSLSPSFDIFNEAKAQQVVRAWVAANDNTFVRQYIHAQEQFYRPHLVAGDNPTIWQLLFRAA
jgi:hypothetical protein